MQLFRARPLAAAVLMGLVFTAACETETLVEQAGGTVTNVTDSLVVAAVTTTGVAGFQTFELRTTTGRMILESTTLPTRGTATLAIADATPRQIFFGDLQAAQLVTLDPTSQPGTWRVQLVLENFAGQLAFRIRRAP